MNIKLIPVIFAIIFFLGCQSNNPDTWEEKEKSGLEIQKLIDQLPAQGGEVKLPEGTFVIDQPLKLRDNAWLHGSGRSTVLSVTDSVGIMLDSLRGAKVSDLVVKSAERRGATAGILIDNSGDCQVHSVLTQGFEKYGIWVRNNTFLSEISSCTSADNGRANYYLERLTSRGRVGDFVPNVINNCISYGGQYGFEFKNALVVNLTGCSVFQSLDYAYYLHTRSNSINISGSRSFQAGSDAIFIDESHEVNISSNIFCWQRGHGIVLNNAKWGTVSSNNFIDNGTRTRDGSYRNGVVLQNETKGIHVTSNAIFNWGDQPPMEYGITEDETCMNNLIAHNNINYYIQEGILSQGKGTLVRDNIMQGDNSYIGMDRPQQYPDFDTTRLHNFMLNP